MCFHSPAVRTCDRTGFSGAFESPRTAEKPLMAEGLLQSLFGMSEIAVCGNEETATGGEWRFDGHHGDRVVDRLQAVGLPEMVDGHRRSRSGRFRRRPTPRPPRPKFRWRWWALFRPK